MKVSSNKITDVYAHYLAQLSVKWSSQESTGILKQFFHHFLQIPPHQLVHNFEKRISESQLLLIHFAVKDLMSNKPIQYILGVTSFLDLELHINENALIPRPETEELVSKIIYSYSDHHPQRILDIGTGSGCIALALKSKFPESEVWAVDFSSSAIELAQKNADALQLKVNFLILDILDSNSTEDLPEKFDLIVSNPPYVLPSEKPLMQANVLDYEPHAALFVPENDPLLFYRKIAQRANASLTEGGHLWFEINENQSPAMQEMLQPWFQFTEVIHDFRDRIRFTHSIK
jgi:release factor glutamine methyltransferase